MNDRTIHDAVCNEFHSGLGNIQNSRQPGNGNAHDLTAQDGNLFGPGVGSDRTEFLETVIDVLHHERLQFR